MNVLIKRKRIKNLYVRVDAEGNIVVSAPRHLSEKAIFSFLEKKKDKLNSIAEKRKAERIIYENGSLLPYLGEFIVLKVFNSDKEKTVFNEKKKFLEIYSPKTASHFVEEKVWEWYKYEVLKIVKPMALSYASLLGKDIKRISVKRMKTRWGSCNSVKGYLNFNSNLALKRMEGIQYVVAHEVAHLVCPGHGKDFYKTVGYLYPEWQKGKSVLYE